VGAKFQAQAGVAEIDLYSDVFPGTAKYLRDQLKSFGDGPVTVCLNSPGGDVLEGVAIYNVLNARGNVKMRVEGLAASIASIIMMAGKEIEICSGAFVMVHNPWAMSMGESDDLRSTADVLDKMKSSMASIYAKRTGLDEDEVVALMNDETWMTAEEAVEKGFADKVLDGPGASAKASLGTCAQYFAKVPAALLVQELKAEQSSAAVTEGKKMSEEDKKKMEALEAQVAALTKALEAKKAEDEEEEEEEPAAAAAVPASAQALVDTTKALADANKEIVRMRKHLDGLARKDFEAKVDGAIKSGKLMPALKAWALSQTESTFDSYLASMGDAVVAPIGVEHREPTSAAGASQLSKNEKKVAKALGLSEEEAVKARSLPVATFSRNFQDGDK
jgi:ATP-dependent Clp protease, protease subunit